MITMKQKLLATARQMRAIDRAAIEELGIPGVVLMENAGKGTVDIISRRLGDLAGREIVIFAGPGNNGGDGFVIARHLHQLGAVPHVVLAAPVDRVNGDAAVNLAIVEALPIEITMLLAGDDFLKIRPLVQGASLLVDALLGTGLARDVSGHYSGIISLINDSGQEILAVDIPSGLNSDTGQPQGACVRADLTASYGLLKLGQVVYPGADFCGDLHLVDIGIPPHIVEKVGITAELLQRDCLQNKLSLDRDLNSHKGCFGHLLVVAGSQGKSGAASLAALAALRSGSGLVSMAVPEPICSIVAGSCLESMTISVGSKSFMTAADYPIIADAMANKDVVLLGPGLGTESQTAQLTERLYREVPLPMIVDADGLNNLAGCLSGKSPALRILTPHPGEMARLTGMSSEDVQANRLAVATSFAQKNGVILVLKGAATIIAHPDGRLAVNSTGNPAMAAGGMGDVLGGVIAALVGQGVAPWQAACLGVYVHGLAADRLSVNNRVKSGVLASEVADELPLAFNEVGL